MAPIARFSANVVRSPKSGKIAICVATATPNPASTLAIDSTRDIVRD
jgi:hypothetical protein